MRDDRDHADLERDDIAVYNFRGYSVIRFWKRQAHDGMKHAMLFVPENAYSCIYCPDDYRLMAEFLQECYRFCRGEVDDVKHVRVS